MARNLLGSTLNSVALQFVVIYDKNPNNQIGVAFNLLKH